MRQETNKLKKMAFWRSAYTLVAVWGVLAGCSSGSSIAEKPEVVQTAGGLDEDSENTSEGSFGRVVEIGPNQIVCFENLCPGDIPKNLRPEEAANLLAKIGDQLNQNRGLRPIDCHVIAHEIGKSVARGDVDLEDLFMPYDGVCNGGYIHGALQVYGPSHDLSEKMETMAKLCIEKSNNKYYPRVDCLHGLGHAVGKNAGDNVIGALEACKPLIGESEQECIGGVLMEYYERSDINASEDVEVFCEQFQEEEHIFECQRARWALALKAGEEVDSYIKNCSGKGRLQCVEGAGYWAAIEYQNPEEVFGLCQSLTTEMQEPCTDGAVHRYIESRTSDGTRLEELISVCPEAGDLENTCREIENRWLKVFGGN